jgi:hypothetical protein
MEGQLHPDRIQEIVPGVVSCNSSYPAAIPLAAEALLADKLRGGEWNLARTGSADTAN